MLSVELPGVAALDARPLFVAVLAVHVFAGLTGVVAGALAATARKRRGRHPRAGTVYLVTLAAIGVTAAVMVLMRGQKWHLLVIATVAVGLGATGWLARRRRWHRWVLWHGIAMPGSYVAMLTGFYVDNGPRLLVWDQLPVLAFWVGPALVGLPLTVLALIRNHALPARSRRCLGQLPGGVC